MLGPLKNLSPSTAAPFGFGFQGYRVTLVNHDLEQCGFLLFLLYFLRLRFAPLLRTSLISTLLPSACATRINVPLVRFRGSFSIADIFGALISARAASLVWLRFSAALSLAICTPNCRFSSSLSTHSRSFGSSICLS